MTGLTTSPKRLATLAAALGLVSAAALARPAEYEVNVREACRQAVAGGYLKAYDEHERIATMLEALDDQDKALAAALARARAAAGAADADARTQEYDVTVAGRQGETASVVAGLAAQRAETAAQRRATAASLGASQADERRLRELVGKVFLVERVRDRQGGGYPVRLTYRAACPKYRALCPLPAKDADELLRILIGGAVPEPCQRYAKFTKIK